MTSFFKYISAILVLSILTTSCKKECTDCNTKTDNATISLKLTNNSNPVAVGDTTMLDNGYDFYLSAFRLYISNITAIKSNGDEVALKNVVLFNLEDHPDQTFWFTIPAGSYKSIRMGFGVDSIQNESDPNSFANENPLSVYQGMYWGMLKYRFAVMEGRAMKNDTISISYHTGTNALYKVHTFDFNYDVANDEFVSLDLSFDLNKIFDGPGGKMNLPTEVFTHSMPSDYYIAKKFMENLEVAGTLNAGIAMP